MYALAVASNGDLVASWSLGSSFGIARWNGTAWTVANIADGGSELFASQPDYTGLSAIDPAETATLAVTTFNNAYSIGASFQGTVTISDNADTPLVNVRSGAVGTEGVRRLGDRRRHRRLRGPRGSSLALVRSSPTRRA